MLGTVGGALGVEVPPDIPGAVGEALDLVLGEAAVERDGEAVTLAVGVGLGVAEGVGEGGSDCLAGSEHPSITIAPAPVAVANNIFLLESCQPPPLRFKANTSASSDGVSSIGSGSFLLIIISSRGFK
jgi:hypothetical protein